MNKVELLAPAGNFLKMQTALAHGMQFILVFLIFSLRVRINDFNLESLATAINYVHNKKKKSIFWLIFLLIIII